MGDGTRLVKTMRELSRPIENHVVDLVVGKVTSLNPLKVKLDKIELTDDFLIVGAMCKQKTIDIPVMSTSTAGSTEPHKHTTPKITVTLWRGLKVGDTVYLIKYSKGQKYFLLQREEGID